MMLEGKRTRTNYSKDIIGETSEKMDELHNASDMTSFGGSTSAHQLQLLCNNDFTLNS